MILIFYHYFFCSGRFGTTTEDGRVYNADNLINSKNETPLHMAAINSACHSNTIKVLHKNFPSHSSRAAEDGLPLHYACQVTTNYRVIRQVVPKV